MKKLYFSAAILVGTLFSAQSVFFNEINTLKPASSRINEFVEIAGTTGTNIGGYKILVYSSTGTVLDLFTIPVGTVFSNTGSGMGVYANDYAVDVLPDTLGAVALVDASGNVVQFLSWGGTVTAVEGKATGQTSTNIGVTESSYQGRTMSLVGNGRVYTDFTWKGDATSTENAQNEGQQLLKVKDAQTLRNVFVKNTLVTDSITFGVKSDVKIVNMAGQVVKSFRSEKNTATSVSSLPTGVYVVTGDVNGEPVSVKITKK